MSESIIRKLFHDDVTSVTLKDKGLTNQNWLVESRNERFMVRIPFKDSDQDVSRIHEKAAIDLIMHENLNLKPSISMFPTALKSRATLRIF